MVLMALLSSAGVMLAQHEAHPMEGAPTGEGACLAHAKEGLRIVENASRQLEEARQTNSPQQMRGAISGLQAALAEIRTQLSLCVRPGAGGSGVLGMEGMDHSKMGHEKPAAPKSEKPPSGEMDHSKMGKAKPAAPPATQAKDTTDPAPLLAHGKKVMGTVTAVSAGSIEVKTTDGKTARVSLTPNTKYMKGENAAAIGDVKVGLRVSVHLADDGSAGEVYLGSDSGSTQP